MKTLAISAMLAALVIGANLSLVHANTQQISKVAATEANTKLKLNQATAEQLAAVPGLGKVKAQAIVDHVKEHGAIKSENELTKVKGIGNKLAAKVAEYVSFD